MSSNTKVNIQNYKFEVVLHGIPGQLTNFLKQIINRKF